MTFPQAGTPLSHVPNAKVQNFYVIAPQTAMPQGAIPPIHDHTIQAAPGDSGWTPFMHGYFVVCSAEGRTSGDCVATSPTSWRWNPAAGNECERRAADFRRDDRGRHRYGSARLVRYGRGVYRGRQPCEVTSVVS